VANGRGQRRREGKGREGKGREAKSRGARRREEQNSKGKKKGEGELAGCELIALRECDRGEPQHTRLGNAQASLELRSGSLCH
jgi:hypothetical protein